MKEITLKIEKIVFSGHGIGFYENKKIYVLGAFPGDKIKVYVYKQIKDIFYGEIISFLSYSHLRSSFPKEKPFFPANAPWQHLSLNAENNFKKELLYNLYKDDTEKDINISLQNLDEIYTHGYRNKVAYSFMNVGKKKGQLAFALYTRGINGSEKIPQTENLLVHPLLEKTGKQFLQFFNQKNIGLREIKYLILRYSYLENLVVAHILFPETNRKKLTIKKKEWELFLKQTKNLKGILISHSPAKIRSALTTKDFYSLGDIEIKEKILDKIYSYHPSLFFQIYPKAFEEILIDLRTKILEIKNHAELPVLDLFAGVGLIGLSVADSVKKVNGVELSSLSEKYAYLNAEQNNIKNFSFHETNVDEALSFIKNEQILIVDPPRSGLSKKILHTIREKKPKYIFYISCNTETQKRDFLKIKNLYEIKFIKAYNIFPKTHHFESMIFLEKK